MGKSLHDSFFKFGHGVYNAPPSCILIVEYLETEQEISTKFDKPDVQSFFVNCKSGRTGYDKGTGIEKEKIKNYYDGNKYFDDNTLEEDIRSKKSLQKLLILLYENRSLYNLTEKTKSTIIHIFNELDRNVRNHSGFKDVENKEYTYQFMFFPRLNQLQIAIRDSGVGISGSLKNKKADPVLQAVKEGVSAHSNFDFTNGPGRNSGYGLYLMNELGRCGHIFEIIDNGKYYLSNNYKGLKYSSYHSEYKGFLLVSMIINLETITEDLLNINNLTNSKSSKSEINYLKKNILDELFSFSIENEV